MWFESVLLFVLCHELRYFNILRFFGVPNVHNFFFGLDDSMFIDCFTLLLNGCYVKWDWIRHRKFHFSCLWLIIPKSIACHCHFDDGFICAFLFDFVFFLLFAIFHTFYTKSAIESGKNEKNPLFYIHLHLHFNVNRWNWMTWQVSVCKRGSIESLRRCRLKC